MARPGGLCGRQDWGALAASGGGQGCSPRHGTHRMAPHKAPSDTTPSAEQTSRDPPRPPPPQGQPSLPSLRWPLTALPPLPTADAFSFCLLCACSAVSHSLQPVDCSPPGSSVRGDSPGKNPGVRCHFLLQWIFPTQGSNSRLLRWQEGCLPLGHL